MTLSLTFQAEIWNLLNFGQKWPDCHETKSNYIDWTLSLKCDHQVWPWPWPWPLIFKVKYVICYISTKSDPVATKRKANIYWLITMPQMWPMGLTSTMTLTFEFSWSNVTLTTHMALTMMDSCISECEQFLRKAWQLKAIWHWTNGVGVGHSWPWLWPFGDQGQV